MISTCGIFVIQHIARRNGNIITWANGTKWKNQLADGTGFEFANPLEQNEIHIQEGSKILQIPRDKFQSLIVFNNKVVFKRDMPPNVLHFQEAGEFIRSHSQTTVFSLAQLDKLQKRITQI